LSNTGHRGGKGKTLEIPAEPKQPGGGPSNVWESETTTTGSMPTGWDAESTYSGPAPTWDDQTGADDAPPNWAEEVAAVDDGERTVEQPSSPDAAQPKAKAERPRPPTPERPGEKTVVGPPADFKLSPAKRRSGRPPPGAQGDWVPRPPIEVEVRKVSGANALARRVAPAYEVWTKNRVYALDVRMVCVDVIDLATGQSDTRHPFMGGHLVGGQQRKGQSSELSFPLPTPGSEAVFQTLDPGGRPRLMVTSKVTRVLLHVQVVKVTQDQQDVTWDTITGIIETE
jgi:hypothetical protein